MDAFTSIRVADLRREIEAIQELNKNFRLRGHSRQDRAAYQKRKIRLEQIKQELAALRPTILELDADRKRFSAQRHRTPSRRNLSL
jgi:hypothetical protein